MRAETSQSGQKAGKKGAVNEMIKAGGLNDYFFQLHVCIKLWAHWHMMLWRSKV